MNAPSPNQPLSRDSILSVLRAAERPLSVAQIATRLNESNVVGVFQSTIRAMLYSGPASATAWPGTTPHIGGRVRVNRPIRAFLFHQPPPKLERPRRTACGSTKYLETACICRHRSGKPGWEESDKADL